MNTSAIYQARTTDTSSSDTTSGDFTSGEQFIVNIYPNPVQQSLTISHLPAAVEEIVTYDVLGNKLKTYPVRYESKLQIDVQDWAEGVYFIQGRTSSGKQIFTQTVTKME
jgi:hypothetical protein